jgi:hypothetical protein
VFASPVMAGGRLYIPSRDGSTAVVKAGSEFEMLATNELDDSFSASPAVSGDALFLRGDRFLYRIATPEAPEADAESPRVLRDFWKSPAGPSSFVYL